VLRDHIADLEQRLAAADQSVTDLRALTGVQLTKLAAAEAREKAARAQEPTEAMLIAAHDWSLAKYGKAIGNDAAIGCWKAMLYALTDDELVDKERGA
jgi:cell division septum initiation protein DivIVA